jgi:CRP/FNR family transcriptional regulator
MKIEDNICDCDKCELKSLFFISVNQAEISRLCNRKVEKFYSQGESILQEKSNIEEFVYLKSGLVKLFRSSENGKEQIITIAKPFDFVSLLSVFSDQHYNYSVTALEDSVTCNLDLSDIKELISSNGKFARNIIEKMSKVSDKIILESLEIRQKHLRGRVAYILLHFADDIYNSSEFELPLSRKEIAEYIGMTTENVIRTLSEFRKDKILKTFGKTIEVIDKDKLHKISDFG